MLFDILIIHIFFQNNKLILLHCQKRSSQFFPFIASSFKSIQSVTTCTGTQIPHYQHVHGPVHVHTHTQRCGELSTAHGANAAAAKANRFLYGNKVLV